MKTLIALSLLAASAVACAQGSGFYLGGSIGQSNTRFKTEDFTFSSPLVAESENRTATAWKLFAGYEFNRYLAAEAGYTDLGSPKYKVMGIGGLSGAAQAKAAESAWFAATKGSLPINQQFDLFAKLGLTRNHLKDSASGVIGGIDVADTATKNRTGALVGVGAEYLPAKNIGVRIEYENYGRFGNQNDTGRTSAEVWSVGVAYKF